MFSDATFVDKKPSAKGLSGKQHNEIMAALNNHFRMFLHMERMVEKMQRKVDMVFERMGGGDATEKASPVSANTYLGFQRETEPVESP